MKVIEAVIHQLKLQEVRDALDDVGVYDYMESPVYCHGEGRRQEMTFRGARFVAEIVHKVKLEIISADDATVKIIEAIGSVFRYGRREDCRIAIRPYVEV